MLYGCSRPGTRTTTHLINLPTGRPDSLHCDLRSFINFQGHSPKQDAADIRVRIWYGLITSRLNNDSVQMSTATRCRRMLIRPLDRLGVVPSQNVMVSASQHWCIEAS